MKSRIQKSIIALLLCLTLVSGSSISAIQANASDLSSNNQADNEAQGGQNADPDKGNPGDQDMDSSEVLKDSEQNDEEKQEEVSD